jgi:hypothetical protein
MKSDLKLLFLDVDGVLNSTNWFKSDERKAELKTAEDHHHTHIDPKAVDQLNRIVFETDCTIILSSTWRRLYSLGEFLRILRKKGLTERSWSAFIDKTPILDGKTEGGIYTAVIRGDEIAAWLKAHPKADGAVVVILDDDADMGDLLPNLVCTHGIEGLTTETADEVIRRLNQVPVAQPA